MPRVYGVPAPKNDENLTRKSTDQPAEQKESPPGVSSGGPSQQGYSAGCVNSGEPLVNAILAVAQAQSRVQDLIDDFAQLAPNEADMNISPDIRRYLKAQVALALDLYKRCWSTDLRCDFAAVIGVPFEEFEKALLGLAFIVDQPVGPYGGAVTPVPDDGGES